MTERISDNEPDKRDIPSFIEPLPPLVSNPFMRPKPVKGTNLMEFFEEDSEYEDPELLQVYLRLKPCQKCSKLYEVRSKQCLITCTDLATAGHGRSTQHNISKMYTFSKIFEADASQKEIFESVVKDNLKKLPDGHSYTLLTYGASGSGKTYTLMGTVGAPGLVPRSLEYMFKVVEAAQHPVFKPSENGAEKLSKYRQECEIQWVTKLRNVSAPLRDKYRRMSTKLQSEYSASTIDLTNKTKYYVWVSFVEIYNEGLYDLLVPSDRRSASTLRIREDSSGLAYVKGASQVFVRSGDEAYDVMVAGKHNLQVAATGVHARSSRSHCIFTITLLTETENGEVRASCVRLCDLAGSERAGRTRNTGARMQESRAINSSLHVLERCLHTLRRKQRIAGAANLVPYRESKLTRLLGSGLSGARGEAVSMVVTVNPDAEFVQETRHVLQLAAVAKDIQVNNTVYPESTYLDTDSTQDTTAETSVEVMRLRADNERLHFELVQAQSRAKQLESEINKSRQKTALEKTELVNEAKASMVQCYESMLAATKKLHQEEIEELKEEYEEKLRRSVPSGDGTPTRLQLVVAKLQKEVAVLEEKLNVELLARDRAEEELQYLRRCIEERDMATTSDPGEILTISDDDDESEDPFNESLEPTFNTINTKKNDSVQLGNVDEIEVIENDDTLYDESEQVSKSINYKRGTYLVADVVFDRSVDSGCNLSKTNRESKEDTNFLIEEVVKETKRDSSIANDKVNVSFEDKEICKIPKIMLSKQQFSSFRNTVESNESLALFEQCEKEIAREVKLTDESISLKEKRTYVADNKLKEAPEKQPIAEKVVSQNNKAYFDNASVAIVVKRVTEEVLLSKSKSYDVENSDKEDQEAIKKNDGEKKVDCAESRSYLEEDSFGTKLSAIAKETVQHTYLADDKFKKAAAIPEKQPIKEKEVSQHNKFFFDNASVANVDKDVTEEVLLSKSKSYDVEYPDGKDQESITKNVGEKKLDCAKSRSYLKEDSFGIKFSAIAKETAEFSNNETFGDIKKKTFFDNIVNLPDNPSVFKDKMPNNYDLITIKKPLGDIKTFKTDSLSSFNNNLLSKEHDSMDLFDDPVTPNSEAVETAKDDIDTVQESMRKISLVEAPQPLKQTENDDVFKFPKEMDTTYNPGTINQTNVSNKSNDTEVDFENLYNNVTASRITEFNLILQQAINNTDLCEDLINNSTQQRETTDGKEEYRADTNNTSIKEGEIKSVKKYNLRHKANSESDENGPEWTSKSTVKTKRCLRLRGQRFVDKDVTVNSENPSEKLKDIANLQKEFSDVTMDNPVAEKISQDIPSPEKKDGDENVACLMDTQSCPSKSVTRSRRKLFTPRAEPLDESPDQTGDSNEPARLHVPRPSYHKGRAKRKCQF